MITLLTSGILVLATALTAVPVILRVAPASRASAAFRIATTAAAALTVAGYALLAHACIRDSCIAAAATIPVDCR
jgi:hypothetical protein